MSYAAVILNNSDKRNVYLIGALGILIGIVGILLDFYLIALLPFAIGMVFLCYFKPVFYVLLICFIVPLSVFIDDVGGGLGLSIPTEPMIWIAFVMFVYQSIVNGVIKVDFIKMPLTAFIIANLIWMLIATLTSSLFIVSLKYFIARLWFVGVFYFFLFTVFKNPNFIRKYLSYMIYGTFLVVLITLIKHSQEGFVRSWGYDIMQPFFEDHTIYSAYISFFIPITFVFALRGNWFNFKPLHRFIFLGIAITLLFGIVFSFTRASWISLIIASVFYVLIKFKVKFKHLMYALGFVIAFGLFQQEKILYSLEGNKQGSADDLEAHAQSVSNITTDPSNLERVNRWHCALLMFKEKPIFGFGPGTYVFKYATFQRPEDLTIISTHSGDLGNTHSEYFNALSETGALGFITWLGVFLASVATGLQIVYSKDSDPWKKSLATAILLGVISYYVHAFLNNFSDFDKIAIPLWGFLAVLSALKYYKSEREMNAMNTNK